MIKKVEFSSAQINRLLPHKFPFCMVDRAYNIVPGVSGDGKKCVTANEWFFQGHFPGEPILPGVIIVECLAQLSALVYLSDLLDEADLEDLAKTVGYLAKINVKFYKTVKPGTTLELHSEIQKKLDRLFQFKVVAKDEKRIVTEGLISVSSKDNSIF